MGIDDALKISENYRQIDELRSYLEEKVSEAFVLHEIASLLESIAERSDYNSEGGGELCTFIKTSF